MQVDGPESMHGDEALMPGFTGACEFELIVPFQDQITYLVGTGARPLSTRV